MPKITKPKPEFMNIASSPTIVALKRGKKELLKLGIILIFIWAVIDIVGIGGNARFYAKWVVCWEKPVVIVLGSKNTVSHYIDPPTFSLVRLSPEQFCSPREAELAGYSANKNGYSFEHLSQEEIRENYNRRWGL